MGYGPVRTWARWDYLDDEIRRCKRRQISTPTGFSGGRRAARMRKAAQNLHSRGGPEVDFRLLPILRKILPRALPDFLALTNWA